MILANPATGSIAPGKDKKIKLKADVKEKVNLNFKLTVMLGTEAHFLNVRVRSVTGVFGTDPATLDHVEDNGLRVPEVLVLMKRSLVDSQGLKSEGIFRLAGDVFEIAKLKEDMNKKTFDKSDNINTIATLIKVWFRELPEPILNKVPTESIFYSSDADRCIKAYTELAEPYKSYLTWLLDLLCETTAHSAVNRMTPQNLSIVVAPNLYDTSSSDPMEGLVMSQKCVQFLNNILLWYLEQKTGSVPNQVVSPSIPLKKDGTDANSGSLIITPRGSSKSPTKQRRGLQRNATEGPASSSSLSRSNETLESPRKSPSNSPRTGVRRNKSIREGGSPVTPRNRPSHPAPAIPAAGNQLVSLVGILDSESESQTAAAADATNSNTGAMSSSGTPRSPHTLTSTPRLDNGTSSDPLSARMNVLPPPTPLQVPTTDYTAATAPTASEPSLSDGAPAGVDQASTETATSPTEDTANEFSAEPLDVDAESPEQQTTFSEEHLTDDSTQYNLETPTVTVPEVTHLAPVAPDAGSSIPGTPPPTSATPGSPSLDLNRSAAVSVGSMGVTPREDSNSARSVHTPTSEGQSSVSHPFEPQSHSGPIGVPLELDEASTTPREAEAEQQPQTPTSARTGDEHFEEDVVEAEFDVNYARAPLQGLPATHSFLPPPSPGLTR